MKCKEMPVISVIVPIYKAEKYLKRCVNSILNQSYKDIEVILVNDGALDSCPEICDIYASADSRVRVIHKKNGGVSTARNAGLDVVQGKYVTFVDADDYLEMDMYKRMLDKAIMYDCDVVMCDCVKEYDDVKMIYSHEIRSGLYDFKQLQEEYYPHLLMMENLEYPATISNWTMLCKTQIITSKIKYEPGIRFSEDLLFGAKVMYEAKSFYYMKGEAYYHYTMNPESASHTYVPDKWDDYLVLYSKIRTEFENSKKFDFSYQINMCLLFFVCNTIREIYNTKLSCFEKKRLILKILSNPNVEKMFKCIKVRELQISNKLKVLIMLYKYRLGLSLLINYF